MNSKDDDGISENFTVCRAALYIVCVLGCEVHLRSFRCSTDMQLVSFTCCLCVCAIIIVLWLKVLCIVLKIFVLHQNEYALCEAALIFDNNIEVFTKTK